MFKHMHFFILLMILTPGLVYSQLSVKDSAIFTPLIFGTYSYQWPGGDLAQIFGSNSSIGGGLIFKTKSNWLVGAEGNWLFGGTVKISDVLLSNIVSHEGYVIDPNGFFADIYYYERGFSFYAKFGKLFPVLTPNPNSGITLMAGVGFMQDRIRIHSAQNDLPQITGDYEKGYDRLNSGPAVTASLGYLYLGSTRLLNCYIGFEFIQASTKSKRDMDFDAGLKNNMNYNSQFYSAKFIWFIPLYKRKPQAYYVY